jgi:hypothetical protein
MPAIFKALATINAWTLFIIGWISLAAGYVQLLGIYLNIQMIATPTGAPFIWMPLVGGFICLALSVVLMKLRQMLED